MSDRDERDGCGKAEFDGLSALIRLLLIIGAAIYAATLHAPDDLKNVVGTEVHNSGQEFVTWYCQDDSRFYNCTSNKDETVVESLPTIKGVASKSDRTLVLLFEIGDGEYRLGDITGPQLWIGIPPDTEVIDIATNSKGEKLVGLCKRGNEIFDCIGQPPQEYPVLNDQVPVGLSWGDGSKDKPQLWCRVVKDGVTKAERCP